MARYQGSGSYMLDEYEVPFSFDFDGAYAAAGWTGVAWYVFGYETERDEDTEWTGLEIPTGRLLAHMVGDDREFSFESDELTQLGIDAYCLDCGQVGCSWHTAEVS